MIEISKDRLIELLLCEEVLKRLEAGGLDNWEWYSESLRPQKWYESRRSLNFAL